MLFFQTLPISKMSFYQVKISMSQTFKYLYDGVKPSQKMHITKQTTYFWGIKFPANSPPFLCPSALYPFKINLFSANESLNWNGIDQLLANILVCSIFNKNKMGSRACRGKSLPILRALIFKLMRYLGVLGNELRTNAALCWWMEHIRK